MINDLRDYISKAQEMGEFKLIKGADWDVEIGVIGELMVKNHQSPFLLFDDIKGYPRGFRVALNLFASPRRVALALGLPIGAEGVELARAYKDRMRTGIRSVPPVEVSDAPIKENVLTGDDVDLFRFPSPKYHELDGGRYIGTGALTITRDPEEGWTNLGVYRCQVQDRNTATINISPGHHGRLMREKYWAKGLPCPAAVSCGQEPALFAAGELEVPWGLSEYDYAGGLKGAPVQVTRGVYTDLLIPATSEIVLEGDMMPPSYGTRKEGPFGEYFGYYSAHSIGGKDMPVFKVKAILHRNNPIIQGCPPSRFAAVWSLGREVQLCASVWADLERTLPGVRGVWVMEDSGRGIVVISLKQMYGGHAKQAALVALSCTANARNSRYVIVVDDDIDPSDTSEVLWALGTRSDPKRAIEFLDECWGSAANPILSEEQRARGQFEFSRAIVLACRSYHLINQYPPPIQTSPELAGKVREKWAGILGI